MSLQKAKERIAEAHAALTKAITTLNEAQAGAGLTRDQRVGIHQCTTLLEASRSIVYTTLTQLPR